MRNRTPLARDQRPPLPEFAPVPRATARHDGWTAGRQRAFIEALADTGSVTAACRMVNMAPEGAYALRRHPQAAGLRAAWNAALDMGVLRMKDEAFDRAINGQLVPVFVAGRLAGYRRKKNDRLLMFLLRHYGEDASGRRVTLNLIQAIANAQAVGTAPPPFPLVPSEVGGPARPSSAPFVPSEVEQPARPSSALPARPSSAPSVPGEAGGPGRPAQAPARSLPAPTPAPTPARIEASVATIAGFPPVPLTRAEQAEIEAILTRAAARHRAAGPGDAPNDPYVEVELLPPDHPEAIGWAIEVTETEPRQGNEDWRTLDRPDQSAELAIAVAAVTAARKRGDFTTEALLGSGPDQRVEPGETDEPPPAEGRRD